jgi:ribonuclease BN (tRNA processing enzyme)
MRFQFIGCGDAFGTGGRFQTCFRVEHSDGSFLIDCGASSLIALRRFGVEPNSIGLIAITHLHGDHFGGLPFFLLDAKHISKRTAPLVVVGPTGIEERVTRAREALYAGSSDQPLNFEIRFIELDAGDSASVKGIDIKAFAMSHASGAPSLGLRCSVEGRIVAYTGDTAWTDEILPLSNNADLFIAECSGFEKPIPHHLVWREIEAHLPRLTAKRVALTHFGAEMMGNRHRASGVILAEDGLLLDL